MPNPPQTARVRPLSLHSKDRSPSGLSLALYVSEPRRNRAKSPPEKCFLPTSTSGSPPKFTGENGGSPPVRRWKAGFPAEILGSGLRGWLVVPVVRQFWSNFSPPPPPTCLIVRACPEPRTTRTPTHRKCVNAVACRSNGAKNGRATGTTSSTARRSAAGDDFHQFNPLGRSNLLIRSSFHTR